MWQKSLLFSIMLMTATLCAWSQAVKPKKEAEYFFKLGEAAFITDKLMLAEAFYDSCIFISPTHFQAHFSRAIARENTGNPEGAIIDYSILIHLNPEFTEALWSRAVLHFQLHHYELADHDFSKLLKLPEVETNAVYFQQRYPDSGVSKVATLKTMRAHIYNYLGMVANKLAQYDQAFDYFDEALSIEPDNADILVNRAQTFETVGNLTSAKKDLRTALSIHPDNLLAKYNLARLQEESTSYNDLIDTYSSIIQDTPGFPEAYAKRGLARMNNGDLNGALSDYDSAILYGSGDPVLWMNRGILKLKLSNPDGAYSDLSKAIELRPDLENAWLNRGNALMKLKKYEDAVQNYDVAIMYYPDFAMAYYNRGIARYNQQHKEIACHDIKKALELGMEQAESTLRKMCK